MSDDICEVVITAPDPEWLVEFTRGLVQDRLVASGQTINTVRSIFRWDGEIQDKREARVALRTRTALVSAIVERANREHPYEVPSVVALSIVASSPAYAQWVIDETT
jgi:periplasmic divalent cation tolerance protein